jgi:hypothetical protein
MADWNAKTATPDGTIPDDNAGLIGADSQSATTPSWYSFGTIKAWIKSWIVKADVGLGNVSNNAQFAIANNLSEGTPATMRANLGNNQPVRMNYISGNWYLPDGQSPSSGINSNNLIRFVPFLPRKTVTVTDIGVSISTASAGQNLQLAIYAGNAATGKPTGNALSNTPDISTASTGRVSGTLGAAVTLTAGNLYFVAINMSDATAQVNSQSLSIQNYYATDIGDASLSTLWPVSTSPQSGFSLSRTYASGWLDVTASSFTVAQAFAYAYKVS